MALSESQVIEKLEKRKFSCQRCSKCCRIEPGMVMLTEEDADKAATLLNISREEFIKKYCREIYRDSKVYVGLKEKKNYDCIFWEKEGCSIYEARPLQCRAFPFWPFLVEDDAEWILEKKRCPGLDVAEDALSLSDKLAYYQQEKHAKYLEWK